MTGIGGKQFRWKSDRRGKGKKRIVNTLHVCLSLSLAVTLLQQLSFPCGDIFCCNLILYFLVYRHVFSFFLITNWTKRMGVMEVFEHPACCLRSMDGNLVHSKQVEDRLKCYLFNFRVWSGQADRDRCKLLQGLWLVTNISKVVRKPASHNWSAATSLALASPRRPLWCVASFCPIRRRLPLFCLISCLLFGLFGYRIVFSFISYFLLNCVTV